MPQLDKVTFLSQFFWLCFFYLGFYFMIQKFYLPKISRILSLRRKKMGFSQEGMISVQQENQQVRENYNMLMSKALATSRALFSNLFSRTTNWLDDQAIGLNRTHYKNVNESFFHSLGETSLSQNLLFYHASRQLPEKLTFKLLISQLETMNTKSSPKNLSAQNLDVKKKTKKS
jgi:predicted SprT family Zn-dependent metalloprotease